MEIKHTKMNHTNNTEANLHPKKSCTEFKSDEYFILEFPLFYKTVSDLPARTLTSLQLCSVVELFIVQSNDIHFF